MKGDTMYKVGKTVPGTSQALNTRAGLGQGSQSLP